MQLHDPYEYILRELSDINDADSDDLLRDSLLKSQEFVVQLRRAYRKSPSNIDFSNDELRAAYLLAYYPVHIEILYEILGALPMDKRDLLFNNQKNRACFIGAGPAPEVIGWISFLKDNYPDTDCTMAYIFDKYIDQWHKGLEITRYHLAPEYWVGKLITSYYKFDLLAQSTDWNARIDRAINLSNFFYMQNCVNDLLGDEEQLFHNIIELFRRTRPGSILIISDLIFPKIMGFLSRLVDEIQDENIGSCLCNHCNDRLAFTPNIIVPEIIETELRTGESNLIPRSSTRFCYVALERIADNFETDEEYEDLPF